MEASGGEGDGGSAGTEWLLRVPGWQAELQLRCGTGGSSAQPGSPGPRLQVGARGGAAETCVELCQLRTRPFYSKLPSRILESQKSLGWKGPLKVI